MNPNIKVTFLMMSYNVEAYIERAVRSVLNQTVSDVELYVRNNGSTDRTGEILRRLAAEDQRIIVMTNKTNGITDDGIHIYGKGWWIPDETLAGEYISILDGDDYLEPDFVEILYHAAKEHAADITVAGNYFFSDQGRAGARVPEPIITDSLKELETIFPSIYNCFRTWWGKLYKTEFFFSEYEHAWKYRSPMNWVMDTILMLKYLGRCRKLATVNKPLYNMYIRAGSTYKNRRVDHGLLWGAYALFQNNMEFIQEHRIATQANRSFVYMLHWTYLMEGLQFFSGNMQFVPDEKLFYIKAILNDSIVGQLPADMFEKLYGDLLPYLEEIEAQADGDPSIYSYYIMRLKCFLDTVKEEESNPLNYPLLLGALFDPANRNWFGVKCMELMIRSGSPGIKRNLQNSLEPWKYWSENPSVFINYFCNPIDLTPEVQEAERDLAGYWNEGCYQECYILADAISKAANFSREAMFYRIKILDQSGEHHTAAILAYTSKILFNYDLEMQDLCDFIIKGGYHGQK